MILEPAEIAEAVDMQRRGYALLEWLEEAFEAGFITPHSAHRYATVEASAYAWLDEHYLNLPARARPAREQLDVFSRFFAGYLDSTFDFHLEPGQRLYSPDAHCFCASCSWMVRAPHLRPKKVRDADKRNAQTMQHRFVVRLAQAEGFAEADAKAVADALLADASLRAPLALCTYAADLLQRLRGFTVGAASLALWRRFAWTPEGSPIKGFRLRAADIMEAQALLLARLRERR